MPSSEASALAALLADGLVELVRGRPRTTRRWQAAMARAAARLYAAGDPGDDLRVPVVWALLELSGDLSEDEVARRAEAMLPIEAAELNPPRPPRQAPDKGPTAA